MSDTRIRNIVIVGGGTAGWSVAGYLSHIFAKSPDHRITLIESKRIGTIGVGEATIPPMRQFNAAMGINEADFIKQTDATFKLGIEFDGWRTPGEAYMHPFDDLGLLGQMPFYMHWIRKASEGRYSDPSLYSIVTQAAYAGKFSHPTQDKTALSKIAYAYHFNAGRYAEYLLKLSTARGVVHKRGDVITVNLDNESGFVRSVSMEDGSEIEGDLFIDCTGFKGLLIKEALGGEFEDWSKWLPCDRAVAGPCNDTDPLKPYTRSIAQKAGWRWRIPLQTRVGNGHVYASDFISEDEATDMFINSVESPITQDLNHIRFKAGYIKTPWIKNCVAVGLASGFLEPLESTSIHLIQTAIARLTQYFPDKSFCNATISEYNRRMRLEWEEIRDFLIAHYHLNERDEEFWNYCKNYQIPDSLRETLDLFQHSGLLREYPAGLFKEPSWFFVMLGQGLKPERTNALINLAPLPTVEAHMDQLEDHIRKIVPAMPGHQEYLARITGKFM